MRPIREFLVPGDREIGVAWRGVWAPHTPLSNTHRFGNDSLRFRRLDCI